MNIPETTIGRDPAAAWQEIDGRVLVVTPRTKKVHILDGAGALIWQCLDRPRTLSAVARTICSEYEISETRAQDDAWVFVRELKEKSCVVFEEDNL